MRESSSSRSSSPGSFAGVVFVIVLTGVVVVMTILAGVIVEIVAVVAVVVVMVSVVVVVVCGARSLELRWLSRHSWWVTQLGSASGSCPRRRRRRHGGGGGSWRRTRLGAAFKLADCLPLPWLVGHAAWVCVGGEPLVIVAVAVAVAMMVGSWLAELSQVETIRTERLFATRTRAPAMGILSGLIFIFRVPLLVVHRMLEPAPIPTPEEPPYFLRHPEVLKVSCSVQRITWRCKASSRTLVSPEYIQVTRYEKDDASVMGK